MAMDVFMRDARSSYSNPGLRKRQTSNFWQTVTAGYSSMAPPKERKCRRKVYSASLRALCEIFLEPKLAAQGFPFTNSLRLRTLLFPNLASCGEDLWELGERHKNQAVGIGEHGVAALGDDLAKAR